MEDLEGSNTSDVYTPLLPSDQARTSALSTGKDYIGKHILQTHGEDSWLWQSRQRLQRFLTSKWGHYSVIILVSLDVAGIFANFIITMHICEHKAEKSFNRRAWEHTNEFLDVLSLVFSCLFMLELLLSIWAFGFSYGLSRIDGGYLS